MSCVTIKDAQVTANMLLLHAEDKESIHTRVGTIIQTTKNGASQHRRKKGIERNMRRFFQRLENDKLTCTTVIMHKITMRTDTAPNNVRSYRLPKKHKAEVNKQI